MKTHVQDPHHVIEATTRKKASHSSTKYVRSPSINHNNTKEAEITVYIAESMGLDTTTSNTDTYEAIRKAACYRQKPAFDFKTDLFSHKSVYNEFLDNHINMNDVAFRTTSDETVRELLKNSVHK